MPLLDPVALGAAALALGVIGWRMRFAGATGTKADPMTTPRAE